MIFAPLKSHESKTLSDIKKIWMRSAVQDDQKGPAISTVFKSKIQSDVLSLGIYRHLSKNKWRSRWSRTWAQPNELKRKG